jgi:hypothetical protein
MTAILVCMMELLAGKAALSRLPSSICSTRAGAAADGILAR